MTANEVYSYCSIGFGVFGLIFAGYARQTNEDKANVLMCIIFFLITIPLTKAVFLIAELSGHSLFDEIKSNISWFDVVLFVGVVCLVSAVFEYRRTCWQIGQKIRLVLYSKPTR